MTPFGWFNFSDLGKEKLSHEFDLLYYSSFFNNTLKDHEFDSLNYDRRYNA